MKDFGEKKKYKERKAGKKKQHTSIHRSFTENLEGLTTENLLEKLNKTVESNSFENLINREKSLLQSFLKVRGLPFTMGRYDENGKNINFNLVDASVFVGSVFTLQGIMKRKYDDTPGATIAADGLNCVSAIEQYYNERKFELALIYAMKLISYATQVHLIRHEDVIHAGANKNSDSAKTRAEETNEKKRLAKCWLTKKKKENSRLSKTQLCNLYANENGLAPGTVRNWFNRDLDIK